MPQFNNEVQTYARPNVGSAADLMTFFRSFSLLKIPTERRSTDASFALIWKLS